MNDNERIKQEIDESMGLLDQFDHSAVSDDLARSISQKMTKEYRQHRMRRLLFRIGTPLAAAAAVAAAVAIVSLLTLSGTFRSPTDKVFITPTVQVSAETDQLIAEWAEQEQNAYGLFTDLDFQATRASTSQPVADNGDDEWNTMIFEAFDLASSG